MSLALDLQEISPVIHLSFLLFYMYIHVNIWAPQVAQGVKNPPALQQAQKTPVQSLGQEDPLEEGMATHSHILAWRIPWTEEPGSLQFMGSQRVGYD